MANDKKVETQQETKKAEAKQQEAGKVDVSQKSETQKVETKKKAFYALAEGNEHRLVHPYQNVVFQVDAAVEVEEDDWLKAQLKAGLVKKVSG